jgi:hydroxymethylpyrimidine pyrophosphatase-like HAD family hydrolase
MRYVAVAAGFDGTLAKDGRCDQRCVDALRMLASTGRKLLLVTARKLRELLEIFPEARLFDYIIAENGAVMHRPAERVSSILAVAPSETLLRELRQRAISPLSVGSSIITTAKDNEAVVGEVLQRLRLDCQLLVNDDTLMILPSDVDKATGVAAALRDLGLSAHNLVAIGDAPNDLALLAFAEHSIAVRNAHPSLKAIANRVTEGEYGDGFLEMAQRLIRDDFFDALPRHQLLLGHDATGTEVILNPFQDSLLITGPSGSGRRKLCKSLLNRLNRLDYQCCVIAAEAHDNPEIGRGFARCGTQHEAPRLTDVMTAIEEPSISVFVNVTSLVVEARAAFVEALLLQLHALHDRAGRPHAILILDAHAQFPGGIAKMSGPLSEIAFICTTVVAEALSDSYLTGFDKVIQLGNYHPSLEHGLSTSVPLMLEDLPNVPATLLSRASGSAAQATIEGRAPVVVPSASLAVTESEASGY